MVETGGCRKLSAETTGGGNPGGNAFCVTPPLPSEPKTTSVQRSRPLDDTETTAQQSYTDWEKRVDGNAPAIEND
jgi:hypothetical protein